MTDHLEADNNGDGIPDKYNENLSRILNHEQFGPNGWKNRRLVVFISLILLGLLYTLTNIAILVLIVYQYMWLGEKTVTLDPNIAGIVTTLLWTTSITAASILGSYVFGSNSDTKDLRSKLTELASSSIKPPMVNTNMGGMTVAKPPMSSR